MPTSAASPSSAMRSFRVLIAGACGIVIAIDALPFLVLVAVFRPAGFDLLGLVVVFLGAAAIVTVQLLVILVFARAGNHVRAHRAVGQRGATEQRPSAATVGLDAPDAACLQGTTV